MRYLLLLLGMASSAVYAEEYWIDFGTSAYATRYNSAAKKYAVRTISAGWNNVSVEEQSSRGTALLGSSYFAETVEKDSSSIVATYETRSANLVSIYDTENDGESILSLSITKDTAVGSLQTIQTSKAPTDVLFGDTPRPDWVPASAYGDFIQTYLNDNGSGAYTLTFSGCKAGIYDISVIAGAASYMGSVYEGNDASAIYTLNGTSSYTIEGTNAAGGGYAGVLEWKDVEVSEDGLLTLTVQGGYLGDENGVQKYTSAALNTMVIKMIPEPSISALSLLTLAGMAARRQRRK